MIKGIFEVRMQVLHIKKHLQGVSGALSRNCKQPAYCHKVCQSAHGSTSVGRRRECGGPYVFSRKTPEPKWLWRWNESGDKSGTAYLNGAIVAQDKLLKTVDDFTSLSLKLGPLLKVPLRFTVCAKSSRIFAVLQLASHRWGSVWCSEAFKAMIAWGSTDWFDDVSIAAAAQCINVSSTCSMTRAEFQCFYWYYFRRTDRGFFNTKTITSEKVYKSRGYRLVTANSLFLARGSLAHFNSLSEMIFVAFEILSEGSFSWDFPERRFSLNFAPKGSRSPPSRPSQSAKRIGAYDSAVRGSIYRCTSSEVGTWAPGAPTTGVGYSSVPSRAKSTINLINVLLPAPVCQTNDTRLVVLISRPTWFSLTRKVCFGRLLTGSVLAIKSTNLP